ncbi:PREDICTED: uncharacterized protein C17orf80 homolog [Chrysochloris asiatica]|uniref:Uncharacterized protein C17orf80 homolog n=1 Tax=Chrysochloris asiatica TaxID=185453 RepID=A0A9B0WW79_CHRAS|nr:PREDICTED: uncharacterized protein C17orf80 homolog [Chrysochloris asiatica]
MSDSPPRLEVCPHCKKSFKRLKSHLPFCKMNGTALPADQNVCPSKPAVLSLAKKRKGPVKHLLKAKETSLDSERENRNTKLITNKPEGRKEPLALLGMGTVSNEKTEKHSKSQLPLSLQMLKTATPKKTLPGETKAQFYASENISLQRELDRDWPKLRDSRSNPSEIETSVLLLPIPVEPFSPNQDGKHSSGLPGHVHAPSTNLKLDKIDLPRQELLVRPLDVPLDYPSSVNPSHGVKTVRTSLSQKEKEPKPRKSPECSGIPTTVRYRETQEKNTESLLSGLGVSPSGKTRLEESKAVTLALKERGLLGFEARGNRGSPEKSQSVQEAQVCSLRSCNPKRKPRAADSAAENASQDEGPSGNLAAPRGAVFSEPLAVSESGHPSLTSLALRFLQEERAGGCRLHQVPALQTLMGREGQASLEPRAAHQGQALPTGYQPPLHPSWHHTSQIPVTSPVDATDSRAHPCAMGLEWFPELYPGYLGLRLLPGKPQYWNAMAQKPQLLRPRGERLPQVPLLERRPTDRRILEPPTWLSTSGFSLMRLLGALQKGWSRCSSSVRNGVGGISVLFTGYFGLCWSWSFRNLKLQRWRK